MKLQHCLVMKTTSYYIDARMLANIKQSNKSAEYFPGESESGKCTSRDSDGNVYFALQLMISTADVYG